MGHKGVSKRKPKKTKASANDNMRADKKTSVQTLVKDNGAALSRDGAKPSEESNKKDRKGK